MIFILYFDIFFIEAYFLINLYFLFTLLQDYFSFLSSRYLISCFLKLYLNDLNYF